MDKRKYKVLVVEDDITLNQNINDFLKQNDFDAESVFEGVMAEKCLKENAYDCVVMDIHLPGGNGYELCKGFRLYNKLTPIVILTAFDELDDKIQGFEAGADDYLTKPFFTRELLARINSLINRTRLGNPNSEEIISIQDLVINRGTKSVSRAGKELALTPREYDILLKLAMASGNLVSKKELNRDVWGGLFSTSNNTIEVYINFLRNKIDKPFDKPLIKTKVGFGYYLDI